MCLMVVYTTVSLHYIMLYAHNCFIDRDRLEKVETKNRKEKATFTFFRR